MHNRSRLANLVTLAIFLFSAGCFVLPPPHSDYRAIHQYALACEVGGVQAILSTNPTAVNLPDDSKRTPLHDAASRNCTNVIAMLLEAGAKLESRDQAGETALHVAAQEGCTDAVAMLVKAGAAINARDKSGYTPLKRAMLYQQPAATALLRSLGAKE